MPGGVWGRIRFALLGVLLAVGCGDDSATPIDAAAVTDTCGAAELCNGLDDDCDGVADNGFDLTTDPEHCGACDNACDPANETCGNSVCCPNGFSDLDPDVAGCEYECTRANGGTEQCNNVDDDCNGTIDEGFDKQSDPQLCGDCTPCNLTNAVAGCDEGACTIASCLPDHYDRNTTPGDGCEDHCVTTGAETCDMQDNDCNGITDDGFDLDTDENHCGACSTPCAFAHRTATCVGGDCIAGACAPNYYDDNGSPDDGCEYACTPSNGGVEICDNVDNDCDGDIDDGNPGGGVTCGTTQGNCETGTTVCLNGAVVCPDDIEPMPETCNNADDDCNGVPDNGFNKLTDPRYCNSCAGCTLAHAVPGCSGGACTVAGCLAGWVNLNKVPGDGCEYECTNSGQEVCDGVDNDCDGHVDQADPSFVVVNNCLTAGECAGTTSTCTGLTGWTCIYTDPDVEQTNGVIVAEETLCDGKDNDCDGAPDEIFPLKNSACSENGTFATTRKLGRCAGTGYLSCNVAKTGLRCAITTAGLAAANETCNNIDDDCDGHTDEPYDNGAFTGVRDVVVGPLTINGKTVVMHRYEASRPDATASSSGVVETRACSVEGRLPWAGGDYNEAKAACQSAGMRLCEVTRDGGGQVTSDEWGRFCEGGTNQTFPYGNTFNGNACNGDAYDPIPGLPDQNQAVATGALATCQSLDLSRDQSGNLKEWVEDPRIVSTATVYTLRGGAFDNFELDSTCDVDLTAVPATHTNANTGFRCCGLSCSPGQIECSNTCVNPATSSTNCGACGNTCAGGTSCTNGYCCQTGTRACGDVCVPDAMACP